VNIQIYARDVLKLFLVKSIPFWLAVQKKMRIMI
jgi:hypothetical protein